MPFRSVTRHTRVADDPAEFFRDLRPRKIAALYEQQAQLLRDYKARALDKPDVAIQGATGSGKTLVGLVLAEWRRRKYRNRPVYLCPTRQLVHQVATFATDQLGIPAYPFTKSKHDYPPNEKSAWLSGKSVAVTTYSSVFNISPFFSSPNFLVVDDAHAADQYIGEYWTVRISSSDPAEREIFDELVACLEPFMPKDEYARIYDAPRTQSDYLWVQMIPLPVVVKLEQQISSILDQAADGSDLYFRWHVMKGHLKATQLFISPREILFRPVIPPTETHSPFSGAEQRVYMSATLGRGGELERLSGKKTILRLPSPPGWDGSGVGRRFFMFPSATLSESETDSFLDQLILRTHPPRALILTANDHTAHEFRERFCGAHPEFTVFSAYDLEASKTPFVSTDSSVAVIANRYDGIDFPDDECRLLIIVGRPAGMSLMERYLSERLGARALFAERTRTRVVQAFGRCTRSATDYAILCVAGHGVMDDLLRNEWRGGLDRELQAELEFGELQSRDQSVEELHELARLFLEQSHEWRSVEDEILSLKDGKTEHLPPALTSLHTSAKHEIDYVNAIWREDYESALDSAQHSIAALAGGKELKGYRGIWHYLAGCAAYLLANASGTATTKADQHFRTAQEVAGIRIHTAATQASINDDSPAALYSRLNDGAAHALEQNLLDLGLTNPTEFTKLENEILNGLGQEGTLFESAQQKLGDLLGFVSLNSEDIGDPDPRWIAGDSLCFVFEDHIKKDGGSPLSLNKARQAAAHPKWVVTNVSILSDDADLVPVLVTNADTSHESCRLHLNGVAVWELEDYRRWAKKALSTVRRLRAKLTGAGDIVWRAKAISELDSVQATPSALRDKLKLMAV